MSFRPRPEIENLQACYHGGPNYSELENLGFTPDEICDFSVSANPFGPPTEVKQIISTAVINRYPDSNSTDFKRILSESIGIKTGNIIAGNGSVEIIRTIATTYFEKGDKVIIPQPTFGEYQVSCLICGADIVFHQLQEELHFYLSVDDIVKTIQDVQPKAFFICNPNNPTGQYLNIDEISKIVASCQDCLLIIDEAYVNFTDRPLYSLDLIHQGNVIIIRSMTKDYALAGLRLGYALANEDIIDNLKKVTPPWNVNAVAQLAGIASLKNNDYLDNCRERIRKSRSFLIEQLAFLDMNPLPSDAHFFLVKVNDAARFRQSLLQYGIIVRDCTSFGLTNYIRIAPRSLPECQKLIDAIVHLQK